MKKTPRTRLRTSAALAGWLAFALSALPEGAVPHALRAAASGRATGSAQSSDVDQAQAASIREAARLAQSGQYGQAMAIYRQVYGDDPPPGEPAIAYYETESATETGRQHAIVGLRGLAARYPSEPRYPIALGRILTYNPKTRPEGRRLLARHPADPEAIEALRQSLVWDAHNPAAASAIRAYLARHPDEQLALALNIQSATTRASQEAEAAAQTAAQPAADPAVEAQVRRVRTTDERAAYRALNAHRLEEAERRFKAVLGYSPASVPALAGMGYLRMQQGNYAGAITFLTEAKENGGSGPNLTAALTTSRFWLTMAEAQAALTGKRLADAERLYQNALLLRPDSPDALEGLGSTLLQARQAQAALEIFNRLIKLTPGVPTAWRGLFLAQYGAGNTSEALLVERQTPPAVHAELMRDPEFLRALASADLSAGRDEDAARILQDALDLPFPAGGEGLKADTQLQYAALLFQAGRFDQAAGLYRQVLSADKANVAAWQGLVAAEHASGADGRALLTLEDMPPALYATALADPGFQTVVAAIYAGQGKPDLAQAILEKAIAAQRSSGQKVSPAIELQLAGVYLGRGDAAAAYLIYSRVLREIPDRADAWKGLVASLHGAGRDGEALAQVQRVPVTIRGQLDLDPDFLATLSAVETALGQLAQADELITRAQSLYAVHHLTPSPEFAIAYAHLLNRTANDAALYPELLSLGARRDLSVDQRRAVQKEWIEWAIRRAAQAIAADDPRRSLAILDAAAHTFPATPELLKVLAASYASVGEPEQAVVLFRSQDLTKASAADYKAAVGAALAAHDIRDAETWLHAALAAYPRDPEMLLLAARFEQTRGKGRRAAAYLRAALDASSAPPLAVGLAPATPAADLFLPTPAKPGTLAPLLAPPFLLAPPPALYLPSTSEPYGTSPAPLPSPGFPAPRPPSRLPARTPGRLRDYVPPPS